MKQLLFLIGLLLSSLYCSAQQGRDKKIDSLRLVIYDQDFDLDKRLHAYNRIILIWTNFQVDSAYHYLSSYKSEALKANNLRNIFSTYHYETKLFLYEGKFKEAQQAAKKSLEIALQLNKPNIISNAYSDIGNSFQKAGDLDSALLFFKKAKNVAQINPKKNVAYTRSLINISETYKLKGEYIKSLEIAQQTLALSKSNNFKGFYPAIYILLGEIFLDIEDYPKATNFFQKAITTAQETKNTKQLALSYEFIARINQENNEFISAEENLFKSIKLGQQAQIKSIEGRALWKLAELYTSQNLNQKALNTILQSEQFLTENYDKLELINCFRVKGLIW